MLKVDGATVSALLRSQTDGPSNAKVRRGGLTKERKDSLCQRISVSERHYSGERSNVPSTAAMTTRSMAVSVAVVTLERIESVYDVLTAQAGPPNQDHKNDVLDVDLPLLRVRLLS